VKRTLLLPAALVAAVHGLFAAVPAVAAEIRVAVAANFIEPVREIGALFAKATGHQAVFSSGATGQLYTQITQDAPFEVFLAADQATPQKAIDDGFAVAGSRFTYATGRLALFSKDPALVKGEATLKEGRFAKLAIASPATAPYGAAAVEAMKALGVHGALAPKLVQGKNIAQAYQFVETGNAELGIVALSQIIRHTEGSRWLVPDSLHAPIAQDAVLLKRGAESEAARAFVAFLEGPEGRAVVDRFGYGTGN
jgi:molybdate transport system substrate-binding protein